MNAHDITLAFPHPSLTPSTLRPNYAALTVWQKELSGNAASVSWHLGNGRQGHLALIISEAKYLAITGNVAFVPPLNLPLQPEQAVGATGPQITEANRMHLELKQTFNTYQAVNQALRNLILAAVPHVYVNSLSHDITGFGNVSALTIMTSLWERYGTITQAELAKNLTRMSSPWNPPQPIEDLFLQLTRGSQFASMAQSPLRFPKFFASATRLSRIPDFSPKHAADGAKFATPTKPWKNFKHCSPRPSNTAPHYSRLPAKRDTTLETPQQQSPLRLLRQPQPFHLQWNTRWLWHVSNSKRCCSLSTVVVLKRVTSIDCSTLLLLVPAA
jgi:hypothetical protein